MVLKEDLINLLVSKRGYTKKSARIVITDVFNAVSDYLAVGETVLVRGFGKFEVKEVKSRENVMPGTLERYITKPTKRVHFIQGNTLKTRVRQ